MVEVLIDSPVEEEIENQVQNPVIQPQESNYGQRYLAYEGTGGADGPVYLIEGKEELIEIIPIPVTFAKLTPVQALLLVGQSEHEDHIGNAPILASSIPSQNVDNALKLFMAEFGRDSLETAKTLIEVYPKVALKTLLSLAATQGVEENISSEEERGKIIHENRALDDPIAKHLTSQNGWEWPYYGSVDATLLFIQLAGSYARRYGREFLNTEYTNRTHEKGVLSNSFELAIEWAKARMLKNPDHYIEFYKVNSGGIENKVWRDSYEAYHHKDGSFASNKYGIASFSVQVDAYKAFKAASHLFPQKKEEYDAISEHFKSLILNDFWVEDGDFFALGLERLENGKTLKLEIKTSDMGHILESGILYGDSNDVVHKKESVVSTLFSTDMLSTSGIRTLSKNDIRFNAGAYHNGSVWPRENIKITRGLENHGYYALASDLHKRNIKIWNETGIFPELVRGDGDDIVHLNDRIVRVRSLTSTGSYSYNLEQPGQAVQAWSVASILQSLKQMEKYDARVLPAFSKDPLKRKFEKSVLKRMG